MLRPEVFGQTAVKRSLFRPKLEKAVQKAFQ